MKLFFFERILLHRHLPMSYDKGDGEVGLLNGY